MKETLSSRVGRIISGGANKLISVIENAAPEMVLEEALRDIDSTVYDVRSELGKVLAQKHMAATRLEETKKTHTDLEDKIAFAIKEGREDLAETAVSKQLDLEAQMSVLENSLKDYQTQEKELEGYVAALVAKKRELTQEFQEFKRMRAETHASSVTVSSSRETVPNVDNRVSRVENVFDRMIDRSSNNFCASTHKQLAELEDLSRKNRIAERIAVFKAREISEEK
ncbi:hypothetical protein CHISP_0329 [Chitinispirillum alkaliphilum]|nr:hypothetical protein CHISP_0329 [Chitinispirillum alkaliphilum]